MGDIWQTAQEIEADDSLSTQDTADALTDLLDTFAASQLEPADWANLERLRDSCSAARAIDWIREDQAAGAADDDGDRR